MTFEPELTSNLQNLEQKSGKAEKRKDSHMIIVGKREAEEGKISIRSRNNPDFDGICDLQVGIEMIKDEITAKALPKKKRLLPNQLPRILDQFCPPTILRIEG